MQSFDQFFQPCQQQKRNMFNVCRDQQQIKSTTTKKKLLKFLKFDFIADGRW